MVKAGFIERFARFTEWPEQERIDTFRITVLGKNPFEGALEKMFATHKVKNKPVSVDFASSFLDIKDCHILFISKSENKQVKSIIEKFKSKPVLTIGETSGYTNKGVIINFFETPEGTVHFEISKTNVKNSKVNLDIKLLGYAKLVE